MMPPTNAKDRPCWKSIDHFSMLPYGWIPDDGADFFTQFILNLKGRWLKLCDLAEEHLSKRRLDQLREKGESSELIHYLAEDAQKWTELRSILRGQVRGARVFAVEHCRRYNEEKGLKCVQEVIDGFSDNVNHRISQLDQTIRDLLQFVIILTIPPNKHVRTDFVEEFAWVSIIEAHKSTSVATSMKRLSWVTFIFLPAVFASSLFGMNVDSLKENPDWRWYILFGGAFLILTVVGWLIFKYNPVRGSFPAEGSFFNGTDKQTQIEPWIEGSANYIHDRLSWKNRTWKLNWRKPREKLLV